MSEPVTFEMLQHALNLQREVLELQIKTLGDVLRARLDAMDKATVLLATPIIGNMQLDEILRRLSDLESSIKKE